MRTPELRDIDRDIRDEIRRMKRAEDAGRLAEALDVAKRIDELLSERFDIQAADQ